MEQKSNRTCLVGAGNVSQTHVEALACIPEAQLVAVCDPDGQRARQLGERCGVPHVFTSLDEAITSRTFTRAHVLVPPDRHLSVASELIDAGVDVFVEKPLALSEGDCEKLLARAKGRGVSLGVNHNAVFFPAYMQLRRAVSAKSLGALQHLIVVLNFPYQTLASPGHWMFRDPKNLVYESAIHPFSQIYDLAGPVVRAETTVSGRHEVGADQHFYDTWQVSLVCERATAQLFVSYAGAYRSWQVTAICQDGMLNAEVEHNRLISLDRARWGRYHEPLHLAGRVAVQELGKGLENLAREAESVLRPVPRRDVYFESMKESIACFHRGPVADERIVDGHFGAQVVAICDAATSGVAGDQPATGKAPRTSQGAGRQRNGRCDAVLLGGTGFIGRSLLRQMLDDGMTIRVMARNVAGLPPIFQRAAIQVVGGDIADPAAVTAAVRGAGVVVHLAHGGSFGWDEVESSMVQPAARVAEACLQYGAERLVYAGTIASLYLGDPHAMITGATHTDPRVRERGPYEWGKARSEEVLTEYVRAEGLPLSILRPGVVLGAGGTPFHSGFGVWRAAVHCVGWNSGINPLPLVLVSDVASAIRLALRSEHAVGNSYNLVGDVRLSARECVAELKQTLQRPFVFHPTHPSQHHALQVSKWMTKRILARPRTPFPSYRTVRSMGCVAGFDCSDAKDDLAWAPVDDRDEFTDRGLRIHANGTRG